MRATDLIAGKRDGAELSTEEIGWLVRGFTSGEIPDYQVSAWLMAVLLRGMTPRETADLTMAMVHSGRTLDLSSVGAFVADKHSTGGVGDKTTLVVAPLVSAAGVPVAKMSGRGLGFSGGTIDKLESISGFRTELSPEEFIECVCKVGMAVAAQTVDLAPADGRLYKLRDVTATVESIPLIASSIMSKKIAAGANAVVLDVKVGRGAFMKTLKDARELAIAMRDIGSQVGLQVRAVISGMDQPLGLAVGNALEVAEAVESLRGHGPADVDEVAFTLGAHLLQMAGQVESISEGADLMREMQHSGKGLAKFIQFVEAQGGDSSFINDPARLPQAPALIELPASEAGYIREIDAETIGRAAVVLGGGRAAKGDKIDHAVGFVLRKKLGDRVSVGEPLLTIHASSDLSAKGVMETVRQAFVVGETVPDIPPAVLEVIE